MSEAMFYSPAGYARIWVAEETMIMSEYFATHRKAFVGAALAGAAGALSAIGAGGDWKAAVTAAVIAALGGGVGVGAIGNKEAKPKT